MWEDFDFFAVRGVVRFVKPRAGVEASETVPKKRSHQEIEKGQDENMHSTAERPTFTESDFVI